MREVIYEWDIETLTEDDIHHDHWDKLTQGPKPQELESNQRLVLVRDVFVDGGLQDRQWCYIAESMDFKHEAGQVSGKTAPLRYWDEFMAWERSESLNGATPTPA